MATRSRAVTKEARSSEVPVKRQLDLSDQQCNEPIWKTSRSHRVDFGETNPSLMQFRSLDLLSTTRIEFDAVSTFSFEAGKTIFTDDQKTALEAKFRRKKYPTREEKVKLASILGIDICKVQNWFINRRRKLKKEQRKGAVAQSSVRPVLPGVSLAQTSCKRSFKSSVEFGCFPQFPAQRHDVPKQPNAPFLAGSASHHMMQSFESYTARSSGAQLRLQQPLAVSNLSSVVGPEHLPYQQVYSPFPGTDQRLPQRQLEIEPLARQAETPSHLTHYPPPPVKPVEPDFNQHPAADSRRLADEFPFSYSIAKELPHIFGNFDDQDCLCHPLTPSFEPPTERDPWRDTMALRSDLYHSSPGSLMEDDFTDDALRSYSHVQPNNFNSCCFSDNQISAPPLSTELISKGRNFSFHRQN